MPRYFIEVAYDGTRYSGFQMQQNVNTIQAEVIRALQVIFHHELELKVSSRTDAGVHAKQNFFHTDTDIVFEKKHLYNINSVLPYDIAVKNIFVVKPNASCRFDAISRTYDYYIYKEKNPFLFNRAYYYPYPLNVDLLNVFAERLKQFTDFTSFSKRNTQVKNFNCSIKHAQWYFEKDYWHFEIKADRFLRGMVKAIIGTMLKLAKNKEGIEKFEEIIKSKDCRQADFSAPSEGLFLREIIFKEGIFLK